MEHFYGSYSLTSEKVHEHEVSTMKIILLESLHLVLQKHVPNFFKPKYAYSHRKKTSSFYLL